MLFLLKKLVGFSLLPLSIALGFMAAGACLLLFRVPFRTWGVRLLLVGAAWLAITSNRGVGTALVSVLEQRHASLGPHAAGLPPLSTCRTIVVLGGGHADNSTLSANNRLSSSALSRLVEGVRLAHALPGAALWVSGPSAIAGKPSHARVLADTAVSLGIPRDRIVELTTGHDTEGEAEAVRTGIEAKAGGPVALVTSAWHLPRAVALFRNAGIEVIPCPADYANRANDDFRFTDYFVCDLIGLERSTKAIYEFLGLAWAKVRGRI